MRRASDNTSSKLMAVPMLYDLGRMQVSLLITIDSQRCSPLVSINYQAQFHINASSNIPKLHEIKHYYDYIT